ncbi:hypothetical protein KCTC52924_00587 [Arenibacter antarcticus]|uniref:Universal stress protein n=1 Tax=Arenibacter antarcticus TaxID=2040469 RepID=A0ABW5VBM1_9FLAO|nr:universal stress protein [Arenibacter sp. H213]MCM4169346.1 universal stress protein [Arenibacter sp. H213]
MKNILVPTDFSENSFNAVKYGLELFQEHRCTFYMLHVNPVPSYSGTESNLKSSIANFQDALLSDSREQLKKLIKRIEESAPNSNHTYVPIAVYDYFVDTVKREVQNKNIQLIIMGTKGATGFKKVAIGSNTGDIITKVKCPLLAIPEKAKFSKPKEIAFPTDYHIGYDINVLDNLLEMAEINKSALSILHISKKGEELSQEQLTNKEFLSDYFKDVAHSFHSLTGAKLETAVQCFTESREIDMIAMVAKNLNFFQRILFRPAVEEISYHTKVPFLVLHE